MKSYSYQYDTNPRKLKPDYASSQKKPKKIQNKKSSRAVSKSKERVKREDARQKKKAEKAKSESKKTTISNTRTKFAIGFKCFCIFLVFFLVIYRNSLITQSFAQIQTLRAAITELQKETDQLEINIQNSLNTNNIEQAAKELLGMQKLTNKQIVYISLSKKDYIEPRTEEVIIEEDTGFFENIVNKIKSLF